ncbi:4Fe-4S binding protein [Cloacibacillus sp. An23]|uniref:4Fe-4S dicluster domain-containing protein n=1 Tax=Cloacibacillus sp. An23 TaxID=1965591 RepID=UPI000B3688F6|nr:4Fe-4S binding protein [Cloacibacillus sp. An23]OUO95141.1 (Fe-S)-binding protein [Cloacibacillus sp. An23]
MSHNHTHGSPYTRLIERLNRFPQGAPESKRLYDILKILMTEKEAGLMAQLPIKPFNVRKAAQMWQMPEHEAQKMLDDLAGKALIVDIEQEGEQMYAVPPPMAGFFEFSLMRVRHDIDQKTLSELFYQYITVEEDFMRDLVCGGDIQMGRIFAQEPQIPDEYLLQVLDYERATNVIDTATHIGVSMCYCRHKAMHEGHACDAPMDICMTFNTTAYTLIKYGHAREIDAAECRDLLAQAYDYNLVQFGENVRRRVNFICNCCSCCCEAMLAIKRFGVAQTICSNFLSKANAEKCVGCGKCMKICPVNAIEMTEENGRRKARVVPERCIGCGVCVKNCQTHALMLEPRPNRLITPLDTTHKAVAMATERGKLQDLIFDNKVLFSHRLLAGVLGAILKLPGLQRSFAQAQLKSRYLEKLISKAAGE